MGGRAYPFCYSCGWSHKNLPGTTCKQPKWHQPLDVDEHLQRHYRTTVGAGVPKWVHARLRREATLKGSTPAALAGEILEAWAKRKGGIP